MIFVPFDVTAEDALRLTGLKPFVGSEREPTLIAGDEAPAAGDARPFLGLHNVNRELMAVGCYECEQTITVENANAECPGDPDGRPPAPPRPDEPGSVRPDVQFGSVKRNDPCPCGSGLKFKRCHGA
jgi:SEC-C motif-containing protein